MNDLCQHSACRMISAYSECLRSQCCQFCWRPNSFLALQPLLSLDNLTCSHDFSYSLCIDDSQMKGSSPAFWALYQYNQLLHWTHPQIPQTQHIQYEINIKMCSFHPSLSHLYKWHHHLPPCSTQKMSYDKSLISFHLPYQIHHQALSAPSSKYIKVCNFSSSPLLSPLSKPLSTFSWTTSISS